MNKLKELSLLFLMIFLGVSNAKVVRVNEEKILQEEGSYKAFSITSNDENALVSTSDNMILEIKIKAVLPEADENDLDQKKETYKNYFQTLNQNAFNLFGITGYLDHYISIYSPFVEYTFSKDVFNQIKQSLLTRLSNLEIVDKIYIRDEPNYRKPELRIALQRCGALQTIQQGYYNGRFIKIGIVEPGMMDVNSSFLDSSHCVCYNESNYTERITTHATYMAAIIGGINGICPQSTLYGADLHGTPNQELDFMIQNNVNVINMSFGEANPTGVYGADSCYMDFVVKNYKIIIVASSGNAEGTNSNVGNPGLGYNVITVGSVEDNGTRSSFSSYNVVSGAPKPTVMMYGDNIMLPNSSTIITGTSASCAIVAGVVGLILNRFPTLLYHPQVLTAILMATASDSGHSYSYQSGVNLSDEVGAGIVSFERFEEAYSNAFDGRNTYSTIYTSIYERRMNLVAGKYLQAAICWYADANGELGGTHFTNYELYLYDELDAIMCFSLSETSCVEFIHYQIPESGEYYIQVIETSDAVETNEWIGFCWYQFD